MLPEAADPSSLKCARKLQSLGNANWLAWADDDCERPPAGHLLTYPITVSPGGRVGPLPGAEEFPDLGGKVLGNRGGTLPPVLTT